MRLRGSCTPVGAPSSQENGGPSLRPMAAYHHYWKVNLPCRTRSSLCQALAYIYFEDERGRVKIMKRLTNDEAMRDKGAPMLLSRL